MKIKQLMESIKMNAEELLEKYKNGERSFTGADLREAYLRGANLRGANLREADLRGANLRGAYLREADLSGADLREADLRGAGLRGAYLREAYLRGAGLREADLSGAYLRGADLREADLREAYLRGAYLRGADLSGANLRGAGLRGADLSGANLSGAISYFGEKSAHAPVSILGLKWDILIWGEYIKIGCEEHKTREWRSFSDEKISSMSHEAIEFWNKYKAIILDMARIHVEEN